MSPKSRMGVRLIKTVCLIHVNFTQDKIKTIYQSPASTQFMYQKRKKHQCKCNFFFYFFDERSEFLYIHEADTKKLHETLETLALLPIVAKANCMNSPVHTHTKKAMGFE